MDQQSTNGPGDGDNKSGTNKPEKKLATSRQQGDGPEQKEKETQPGSSNGSDSNRWLSKFAINVGHMVQVFFDRNPDASVPLLQADEAPLQIVPLMERLLQEWSPEWSPEEVRDHYDHVVPRLDLEQLAELTTKTKVRIEQLGEREIPLHLQQLDAALRDYESFREQALASIMSKLDQDETPIISQPDKEVQPAIPETALREEYELPPISSTSGEQLNWPASVEITPPGDSITSDQEPSVDGREPSAIYNKPTQLSPSQMAFMGGQASSTSEVPYRNPDELLDSNAPRVDHSGSPFGTVPIYDQKTVPIVQSSDGSVTGSGPLPGFMPSTIQEEIEDLEEKAINRPFELDDVAKPFDVYSQATQPSSAQKAFMKQASLEPGVVPSIEEADENLLALTSQAGSINAFDEDSEVFILPPGSLSNINITNEPSPVFRALDSIEAAAEEIKQQTIHVSKVPPSLTDQQTLQLNRKLAKPENNATTTDQSGGSNQGDPASAGSSFHTKFGKFVQNIAGVAEFVGNVERVGGLTTPLRAVGQEAGKVPRGLTGFVEAVLASAA